MNTVNDRIARFEELLGTMPECEKGEVLGVARHNIDFAISLMELKHEHFSLFNEAIDGYNRALRLQDDVRTNERLQDYYVVLAQVVYPIR